MGRQWYGNFKSLNGDTWQVELHDSNVATNVELLITDNPTIEYQGEGDGQFKGRIMSSRAKVGFIMRDENDYGNFRDMSTEQEQSWVMKIYKDSVLQWVGMVLADQFEFIREAEETGYAIVNVTACDGLERLKGFKVLPGWFTSGRATFAEVTVQILNMVGLSDEWASSTNYLQVGIQHDNANTHASYGTFDAKIRDLAFVKNNDIFKDAGEIEWDDCQTALQKILQSFGARICHDEGVYIISQVTAYDDTAYPVDYYDNAGAIVGAYGQTYTHRQVVSDGVLPCWEAYPTIRYEPPVRVSIAEFDINNGTITSKTTYNTTKVEGTHDDIITTASNPGRAVRVEFDVDYTTKKYGSGGASQHYKYKAYTRIYADNGAGGTMYQAMSGNWASTVALQDWVTEIDVSPITGIKSKFNQVVELVAPPTGATKVYARVYITRTVMVWNAFINQWLTGSSADDEFTGSVAISQAYNTTTPWQYNKRVSYESDLDSPRDTNSEELKLACPFYNGKKYDVGSVLVKTGASTWGEAGNWSAPWTALTGDLPALLANQAAGLHSDYRATIRGTFRDDGDYRVGHHLYFDSKIWVLNGVIRNLSFDTWEGEWLAILTVYTNVNNGSEGERVLTQGEIYEDKFDDIKVDMSRLREVLGAVPLKILPGEIINNATGAPTSNPGADKYYGVNLFYDYDATNPQLKWNLTEKTQYLYDVISISHTDSPYTFAKTTGEWLIKANTNGGNITINIPTSVGLRAKIHIKKTDAANTITIDANGTETIDGSGTYAMTALNSSVTVISDQTNLIII